MTISRHRAEIKDSPIFKSNIAVDIFHHIVYAVVAGLVYDAID